MGLGVMRIIEPSGDKLELFHHVSTQEETRDTC